MRKDKHKTIRRDVAFEDPDQLAQEGLDLDDDVTLASLEENPDGDSLRARAEDEMFANTERAL
ncbi:MAG: hypothetical protein SPD11_11020 [Sphaerochaetaceae bacterium]|nr:hypothetical protein [Sphaerochaetaceae bacterium]